MYLNFYQLKEKPFSITSDPSCLFESSSFKEALAVFLYGIQERKGIMLITGEVGTGKTTLCKTLLNKLPKTIKTSLILNPQFSEAELLKAVIEDFGLVLSKFTRLQILKVLNKFLLNLYEKGENALLIIDEAQDLNFRQLEQIRLLSNLETTKDKLLQIILVGQPELLQKLSDYRLRQIRQRIAIKYQIQPLKKEEIKPYIEYRLKHAGKKLEITPESYEIIYNFSKGIPRLINLLCDHALLCGFIREKKVLDEEIFNLCVEELK